MNFTAMILSDFRINFNLKGLPILKQTKFIIISTQRSGTTYLSQLLNSHPNIHMGKELFKLDNNTLNVDDDNYRYFQEKLTIKEFLDNFYDKYEKNHRAVGFTIMLNHLKKFPEIIEYIKKHNVKCIYMERKDILRIAFSRFKARTTGIYHTEKIIQTEPITIEFNDLISELNNISSSINELQDIAKNLNALKVTYEDLDSNRVDVLNRIQNYLNLPISQGLTSSLQKTGNDNPSMGIKNYHELIINLENSKYKGLTVHKEKLQGALGGAWDEKTHMTLHAKNFNFGMADFIVKEIKPKNLLEFGSGLGFLSRHIVDSLNISEVYCIEPNEIKGHYDATTGPKLISINIFKDKHPKEIKRTFDLMVSIEVAEHIEREKHDELFDFLVDHTDNWIVFSGARVGQGGHGHIAERPEEEWKEEFTKRGMIFQAQLTEDIRIACDKKNINHRQNLMIFKKPKVSKIKEMITKLFS